MTHCQIENKWFCLIYASESSYQFTYSIHKHYKALRMEVSHPHRRRWRSHQTGSAPQPGCGRWCRFVRPRHTPPPPRGRLSETNRNSSVKRHLWLKTSLELDTTTDCSTCYITVLTVIDDGSCQNCSFFSFYPFRQLTGGLQWIPGVCHICVTRNIVCTSVHLPFPLIYFQCLLLVAAKFSLKICYHVFLSFLFGFCDMWPACSKETVSSFMPSLLLIDLFYVISQDKFLTVTSSFCRANSWWSTCTDHSSCSELSINFRVPSTCESRRNVRN